MKLNVVVVDDETPICEWLVYCIQRAPEQHRIIAAYNGNDALDVILSEQPDLVFTDICMPGIDGLELMRRVKEVLPFTIFVILSNYAEFTYAKQALAMGAMDYVLKSELRSADIMEILNKVSQEKARSLLGKKEDVFRSGCIDLYNFYSTQNEPDYASRFWQKQGMKDEKPYLLLCFPGGKGQENWTNVAQIADSLREKIGGQTYTAIASETGLDFLILQSDRPLQELAQRAFEAIAYRGKTGISLTFQALSDFPAALRQASCAQAATFFSEESNALCYAALTLRSKLDRDFFHQQKKQILELISQRRYTQAADETEKWFSAISRPAPEDVEWAVDYCRRMVMSVEERYYYQQSLPAPAIEIQRSVSECSDRCKHLLKVLQQAHTGKCSASISAALEYIHEHYAEQISMMEVAQQVYWSAEYFSRQFKEEVGENFNTYLTMYRLDRAQELLRRTELRIGEIAERVGYATPGYFSRIYKRYKGLTPEQERESNS